MSKTDMPTTTIQLSTPLTLGDGSTVETLTVREPLVKDFRKSGQQSKNAEDREIIVAALCCGLTLEDMERLTWKDYVNVQTFLFGKGNTEE